MFFMSIPKTLYNSVLKNSSRTFKNLRTRPNCTTAGATAASGWKSNQASSSNSVRIYDTMKCLWSYRVILSVICYLPDGIERFRVLSKNGSFPGTGIVLNCSFPGTEILSNALHCHRSDPTCNKGVDLYDDNFGGTSLGRWLMTSEQPIRGVSDNERLLHYGDKGNYRKS